MTPDRQTAQALADSLTESQIRDYRLNALKVKMESGTVTRSYEGSSFTIDANNCERVIGECNEALAILAATAAAEVRELVTEPLGRGIDFRYRTCA
jgi:hypothetical protein